MKQWPMSADEFAEENAANYIGGRFDPKAAELTIALCIERGIIKSVLVT